MASRGVSPGGALLRASRVFSIPPPLPRPVGDLQSAQVFGSDTATLPHPIHQTITTPQASLARGDWGFKRPLPLRSTTRTSTPFIRVEAIDTFEHITEFGSAADHSVTLQKWQEMGVPLSTPQPKSRGEFRIVPPRSVFEEEIDSIADNDRDLLGQDDLRWKFKGPWLAGQTEGDFKKYLVDDVRKQKPEFQRYLRAACANSLTKEAQQAALENGISDVVIAPIKEADITEEQFTKYVKRLRNTRTELYKLIRKFLDLPPAPSGSASVAEQLLSYMQPGQAIDKSSIAVSKSPYADTGPPKTHPSAGLAYSLSNAYTYNHPVHGPQKEHQPVPARVIMPRNAAAGSFGAALGVGGFVVELPAGHQSFHIADKGLSALRNASKMTLIPGTQNIEPQKVGGSKAWVLPTSARVDPKGRIIMNVDVADPAAVAVHEGREHEIPVPKIPSIITSYGTGARGFASFKEPVLRDQGYGLDFKSSSRSRETPRGQTGPSSQASELR
ncbi:hypothetical protein QTJ16_006391 [Diplocarpon rosae]|uniref:Uncharacterized protein n=1 Tax=Diplocarpon rosae TaxID=946125 RepID=A0AAD9SVE1_9HELO|nr:hypothetical protein QTJ16_006391 [Diplocarpon rosae]PBP28049.1 hypothetical protein BUE80_DR000889 [Diplocarpon rosae]